ncbi:MAG: FHA domain-containing protein [Cellvibrionaceae bacterium]
MDRLIEDLDPDNNTSDFFVDVEELPTDLIIEVLPASRSGSLYVPVTHYPFTIGRAYDNDLILSDDTISPHHLVIGENDEFSIRDLNTDNGTYTEKNKNHTSFKKENFKKEKVDGLLRDVSVPSTYVLGRTTIRLLSRSSNVLPAKPLTSLSRITELCSNLRVALFLLAVYLLTNIYYALESQSLWMDWDAVVVGQFFQLIGPLLVATIFSFISYLMIHKWRFALHLSIACIAFIVQQCISELSGFLSYLFTSNNVSYWVGITLGVITFSLLLAWQLRALSHLSVRRSNWISAAIITPIFLTMILQMSLLSPDFIWQPNMHTALRVNDLRFEKTIFSLEVLSDEIMSELEVGLESELKKSLKNNESVGN